MFKTICAQICTRARFAFKDAQKCTSCAFIEIINIYEFGVLKHVFIIVNIQLETWITFLKPFVHRFALVNVLSSRMRKSARFVHSLKSNMQLEPWITFLKPFVHRFALVHVLCSKMSKSARSVHSLKSSRFLRVCSDKICIYDFDYTV